MDGQTDQQTGVLTEKYAGLPTFLNLRARCYAWVYADKQQSKTYGELKETHSSLSGIQIAFLLAGGVGALEIFCSSIPERAISKARFHLMDDDCVGVLFVCRTEVGCGLWRICFSSMISRNVFPKNRSCKAPNLW